MKKENQLAMYLLEQIDSPHLRIGERGRGKITVLLQKKIGKVVEDFSLRDDTEPEIRLSQDEVESLVTKFYVGKSYEKITGGRCKYQKDKSQVTVMVTVGSDREGKVVYVTTYEKNV